MISSADITLYIPLSIGDYRVLNQPVKLKASANLLGIAAMASDALPRSHSGNVASPSLIPESK
jgi:hypothetical protein